MRKGGSDSEYGYSRQIPLADCGEKVPAYRYPVRIRDFPLTWTGLWKGCSKSSYYNNRRLFNKLYNAYHLP